MAGDYRQGKSDRAEGEQKHRILVCKEPVNPREVSGHEPGDMNRCRHAEVNDSCPKKESGYQLEARRCLPNVHYFRRADPAGIRRDGIGSRFAKSLK